MLSETALNRAIDAGQQAGLDTDEAVVVRVRSSTHVELPRAGVLARVESPGKASLAARQVAIASVWVSRGAPVSTLVCPQLQPFIFDNASVTLWQKLDGCPATEPADLGRTVQTLHSATRNNSPADLPALDYLTDIADWIDRRTDWPAEADRAEFEQRYVRLKHWWDSEAMADPLGVLLVHGDIHRDNTIVTADRGVVLVDLEDSGIGPASWDLVPLAVGVRRFGDSPEDFRAFITGYGSNPFLWSGFERLCEIYELSITVWAIRCAVNSPEVLEQAQVRVEGLLGRNDQTWTML